MRKDDRMPGTMRKGDDVLEYRDCRLRKRTLQRQWMSVLDSMKERSRRKLAI